MKYETYTTYLSHSLKARLKEHANRLKVSQATILRAALDQCLTQLDSLKNDNARVYDFFGLYGTEKETQIDVKGKDDKS